MRWFLMVAAVWCVNAQALDDLQATFYVGGLGQLVDIRNAGDGTNRLFAVRKQGLITIVRPDGEVVDEPFLDISSLVSGGQEQGLLSAAFEPNYAQTGRFYVLYTDNSGSVVLARYEVKATNPDQAKPGSRETLLTLLQPFPNHNGGRLVFGHDGYLYLGTGDGGSANDPMGNAQNPNSLLGKLLRLDVVGAETGFLIPPDNPNVGTSAPDLIFASGLRNPWRMGLDPFTGDLYIADVGQNTWEEVNVQRAGEGHGVNYGWATVEGPSTNPAFEPPVFAYDHMGGRCSISGGEVYRGPHYPGMRGYYFMGDYCSTEIYSLREVDGKWVGTSEILSNISVTTFGRDEVGNLYVGGQGGSIFLLSDGAADMSVRGFDGTMSGTFTADGLPDQGFFLQVAPLDNGQIAVGGSVFTFDEEGNDMWLFGVTVVDLGTKTVRLDLERLSGPKFLDFTAPAADREFIGSMVISAVDCDTIHAVLQTITMGSASFQWNRLTGIEGYACN